MPGDRGKEVSIELLYTRELNERQLSEYRSRPWYEVGPGYPLLEDFVPKHSRVVSRVPFMTLLSCVTELLRSGGKY